VTALHHGVAHAVLLAAISAKSTRGSVFIGWRSR
jgi:hypothetical protein